MSTYTFLPFLTTNISTGIFYAHLVTTTPSINSTSVSNLILCNANGYVPVVLTEVLLTSDKWTANNIVFPEYNFNISIIGVVICKQLGSNPSNTDPILSFSTLTNTLNQNITTGTGKIKLIVEILTNGIVNYSDMYMYAVSNYTNNQSIPYGLIYLLGTSNNTIPYVVPLTSGKIISKHENGINLNGFDRDLQSTSTPKQCYAWDFTNYSIKIQEVYIYVMSNTGNITLWASNSIQAWNNQLTNNDGWISIATTNSLISDTVNIINSSNYSYWKYLKLQSSSVDIILQELEFYNSSILSPNIDLI